MPEPITVSALNLHIKLMLDRDPVLNGVLVRGEISNYKAYPSGHHYFSLKDPEGSIRCVMFRREAVSLRFQPENGMQVLVSGRVSVFPRDGQYQLYCDRMTPDGVGDLYLAFEQLKEKLWKEGLFDLGHKKKIPLHPQRIALITSPAGAAVRDMIRVLGARYPLAKVFVFPVRVQGEEAPGEICMALDLVNHWKAADLILTGRGGGSLEDLWAFNEESVARAIYRSEIPVISAVGHEPDVTIADFVADLRAATPSNGAELAVPDQEELRDRLARLDAGLISAMIRRLREGRNLLDRTRSSPYLQSPRRSLQDRRLLLDYQQQRLVRSYENTLSQRRKQFGQLAASLDALSPLKVLGRGYAIAQKEDGTVAVSTAQVNPGEKLLVRLTDGALDCRVEGKETL